MVHECKPIELKPFTITEAIYYVALKLWLKERKEPNMSMIELVSEVPHCYRSEKVCT